MPQVCLRSISCAFCWVPIAKPSHHLEPTKLQQKQQQPPNSNRNSTKSKRELGTKGQTTKCNGCLLYGVDVQKCNSSTVLQRLTEFGSWYNVRGPQVSECYIYHSKARVVGCRSILKKSCITLSCPSPCVTDLPTISSGMLSKKNNKEDVSFAQIRSMYGRSLSEDRTSCFLHHWHPGNPMSLGMRLYLYLIIWAALDVVSTI